MRALVLGGGRFVGYHLVAAARSRGWHVTVFNHDAVAPPVPGIRWWRGDRACPDDVGALARRTWDAVLDTWTGAPNVVERHVAALAERTRCYCYVSSVVAATAGGGYASRKRVMEQVVRACAERALIVRLGLVLGPREHPGRLPYWLRRLAAPRSVLAPGRPDRPVRYIDVRDAADAILDGVTDGVCGTRSLTSTKAGAATMGELLAAAAQAVGRSRPVTWVGDDFLLRHQVRPWVDIPLWIPQRGMDFDPYAQETDLSLSGAGRGPVATAASTWRWLVQQGGQPEDRPWLSPEREAELLERYHPGPR